MGKENASFQVISRMPWDLMMKVDISCTCLNTELSDFRAVGKSQFLLAGWRWMPQFRSMLDLTSVS